MKKTITTLILSTFALFLLSTGVMAQQYDVPSTYASIEAAVEAINLALDGDPTITEVTIMIEEGTLVERNSNNGFNRPITAIFQGAGVDKTIVQSRRGGRAIPGEPDSLSNRFMEITTDGWDSMDLIFNDITFMYFGRGDNDNGGMFSTSTTKGFSTKFTFSNCVFDSLCAKQGAIGIFANGLTEVYMDNCLVQNCLVYGGSAFAGMIAVDNGGKYEITNTTFIGNERHPWDHRANPLNPIDKGAGRGGVIKVQSGIISQGSEPFPFGAVSLLIENCAFVNNMPLDIASDSIHPAIQLDGVKDTTVNDVTLIDNIFVGNKRDGYDATDVDLIVPTTRDNLGWDMSGNIANTMVTGGSEYLYITDMEEFKISTEYTYTHPSINFTMDGDLPKLIPDEFGIGHVEYTGDGTIISVKDVQKSYVHVYPNPSNGQFEVVLSEQMQNSNYEVFSISGSLIKSGVFYSNQTNLDLSSATKGVYILRVSNNSSSNTMRLILK